MPTKRERIGHEAVPQISPAVLSILSEGLFAMPEGKDAEREAAEWKYFIPDEGKNRIFEQVKDAILAEWVGRRPGTRPNFWWATQAPEKARRRLGGVGDPIHEIFPACVPIYECGVPVIFDAIDPNDPPCYESEAANLQRHSLLLPEEKRRLRKKDFEPEIISVDDDD